MSEHMLQVTHGVIVEDDVQFTLLELSQACQVDSAQLTAWVEEGALAPAGRDAAAWRFDGRALRRATAARRLTRDLHLDPVGLALALDLLDEIEQLRSRLRQLGHSVSGT